MNKELGEITRYNEDLQFMLDNYRRTIKDLSLDRSKQLEASGATKPATDTEVPRMITNYDLLVEARKYINSTTVDSKKTHKSILEKLVPVVKEALTSKDKIYDVTRAIKEYMDLHFMGEWNVYFLFNNLGMMYHNSLSDGYIDFKFGKFVSLVVYKAFDPVSV